MHHLLIRAYKALQARPNGNADIPHKAVVAKRLAQCLNPDLPSGVHQKTLEVYAYIFSVLNVSVLTNYAKTLKTNRDMDRRIVWGEICPFTCQDFAPLYLLHHYLSNQLSYHSLNLSFWHSALLLYGQH
jgi:hypothetical protein